PPWSTPSPYTTLFRSAVTTWTLGTAAGTQTVQATGAGSPVPFSATAKAGAAATIAANSATSQSATAGTAVSTPPSVIVKDANGRSEEHTSELQSPDHL